MQIPASQSPNVNAAGDSVDHFLEGINELIALTTQMSGNFKSFSPSELTRAGLAAYDVGISSIQSRGFYFKFLSSFGTLTNCLDRIDESTINGDFSADILSRAKQIRFPDIV